MVSSRRGGLNLISEKRVDTATAGSDRVIRTTLSLPVLRVTYRTCIKPPRVASGIDRQKGINTRTSSPRASTSSPFDQDGRGFPELVSPAVNGTQSCLHMRVRTVRLR